jgi:sensor histidine kinase regulating citrate/malate metabolism
MCLGTFKMTYPEEDSLYEILIENNRFSACFSLYLQVLAGLFFLNYLVHFGQNEIVKMWRDRNVMVKEMESIFHSLKEAIITIDIDGVNFSNQHGKEILKFIEHKASAYAKSIF